MDKIKLAEELIKNAKDYIEIEKTLKRTFTEKAKTELKKLSDIMMNCIENNIEDKNIYFYDDCFEIKKINNIETKIFHGYLTYTPKVCPKCGCINNGPEDIIKWNFKRNCKIKITKVCNYNTIILLDKQRFYCKHCDKTFTASTNIVDFRKQISRDTHTSVVLDLMTKDSE